MVRGEADSTTTTRLGGHLARLHCSARQFNNGDVGWGASVHRKATFQEAPQKSHQSLRLAGSYGHSTQNDRNNTENMELISTLETHSPNGPLIS